jgi:hypothetical protein
MTIETKFKLGETVWSLASHQAKHHIINSIKVTVNYHDDGKSTIKYRIKGTAADTMANQIWVDEDHLFPTKETLLASL